MPPPHALPAWPSPSVWTGPENGRIHVWRIELAGTPPSPGPLVTDEHRRAERLLSPEGRRRYRNARTALRLLLGRYLGRDPATVEIRVGRHGKPELPGGELSFNLTHSEDLALLAVTPEPLALGIDVEERNDGRPIDRLAERFFSEPEARSYAALPPTERVAAFYRLWTRKEAYLKAWGTGLTFSSRRFTLALDPGAGRLLRETEMPGDDDPGRWWFQDLDPQAGFAAAIAWPGEPRAVRQLAFPWEAWV